MHSPRDERASPPRILSLLLDTRRPRVPGVPPAPRIVSLVQYTILYSDNSEYTTFCSLIK